MLLQFMTMFGAPHVPKYHTLLQARGDLEQALGGGQPRKYVSALENIFYANDLAQSVARVRRFGLSASFAENCRISPTRGFEARLRFIRAEGTVFRKCTTATTCIRVCQTL
jgi:hypothetical protein